MQDKTKANRLVGWIVFAVPLPAWFWRVSHRACPHISPRVRGTQGKGAHREGSWMLKLLRALFLILGIPNAVLGLPLLVVWIQRSSSDAPLGLDALVPAGSAGLTLGLYFLLSLQLRVKGQEALDAVRRGEAFESGPNLIVPAAWAGLGVLVVAVVHATPAGQRALPVAFALLCLFLFAWLGWPGIRPMLRRGPVLRMDAEGIEHFRYGYIPWRVVAGISLEVQRLPRARWLKLHILWLGVRDAQRYLDRWPRATLILPSWTRRARGTREYTPLPVLLHMFGMPPAAIHQAACKLRMRDRAPLLVNWTHEMDGQEVAVRLERETLLAKNRALVQPVLEGAADGVTVEEAALLPHDREILERARAMKPAMEWLRAKENARRSRLPFWLVLTLIFVLSLAVRLLR